MTSTRTPPRLHRLEKIAQRRDRPGLPAIEDERCELCAAPLRADHPHLLDLRNREVRCACAACALLFDNQAAGQGKLRRIPDRRWWLPSVAGDDEVLALLGIPVDLAFVVAGNSDEATAYYPGPFGIVQAEVDEVTWTGLIGDHPALERLIPDVEALLIQRVGNHQSALIVPIDDCFRLAAIVRRTWRGLSGGPDVWQRLREYIDQLAASAKVPPTRLGASISRHVRPAEGRTSEPGRPAEGRTSEPSRPAEGRTSEPGRPAEGRTSEPGRPAEGRTSEPSRPSESTNAHPGGSNARTD